MKLKNRAAVVCPNCGTEMVRARFQLVDGSWLRCWLCECDETAEPEEEMADVASALEEEVRYGTATFVASVTPTNDEEVKEEAIAF